MLADRMRAGRRQSATDPYYSSVSLLLHADGAAGSTIFTDNSPSPSSGTAYGDAQLSAAQARFGSTSIRLDGSGDWFSFPDDSRFSFPGDFTIEFQWFPTSLTGTQGIFDTRASGSGNGLIFYFNAGQLCVYGNNSSGNILAGPAGLTANVWNAVCLSRSGSNLMIHVGGNRLSMATYSTAFNGTKAQFGSDRYAGGGSTPGSYLSGYLDEIRITKGVARYGSSTSYTPQSSPFPNS